MKKNNTLADELNTLTPEQYAKVNNWMGRDMDAAYTLLDQYLEENEAKRRDKKLRIFIFIFCVIGSILLIWGLWTLLGLLDNSAYNGYMNNK